MEAELVVDKLTQRSGPFSPMMRYEVKDAARTEVLA
jgi:hypothetical protein